MWIVIENKPFLNSFWFIILYSINLLNVMCTSWRQHPTKQQLYGHLPPIMKTIQVRWTRHVGHCWRNKYELISGILLWTPSHGQAKAGWLARTYIPQLCADTGCSLEDLLGAMDNRDGWWERVGVIHAGGTTWWWMCTGIYFPKFQETVSISNALDISQEKGDMALSYELISNWRLLWI